MLGVGILLTPPLVASSVGSEVAFWGMWVAGAVVAASGGMIWSELGAMLPEAGGDVAFLRRAFGRGVAAAVGALIFVGAFAGSVAAMAVALCTYQVQTLLSAAFPEAPRLGELALLGVGADQALGALVVLGVTALNAAGARWAAGVQVGLTLVPLLGLAGLAAWGLAFEAATLPPLGAPTGDPRVAWLGVYFTYAGWPAVVYVAGEVRDPGRTLPVAVLGGTVLVAALYGLLCLAFVGVLGWAGLAEAGEAGTALATAVGGQPAAVGVAAGVGLALLASVNGTVLGGARVAWALAAALGVEGRFPLDGRGTPRRLLWLQAALAVGFALSGTFEVLMAWTTAAMVGAGMLTVAAWARLRWAEPERARPFRAPWVAALVYVGAGVAVWAWG